MAAFNSTFQTDLAKPSRVVPIPDTYTRGDNESHTITVLVYDSANPSSGLMAGSVSAAVARQDGNTIPLTTGTKGAATVPVKLADGSTAQATPCTVTLKQACFDCPGQVVVVIRLVNDETITSIFVGSGKVNAGLTNSIIDPGDVITDITALIAAAEQAAEDAQAALTQATAVVSYAEQTGKTDAQKAQARENIGAISDSDLDDLRMTDLQLGGAISDVGHSLAADYNWQTGTYAVGDYVMYGDKLYRCATAIATPETWTPAHWTEVKLTGEVTDLKGAVTAIENLESQEQTVVLSPFVQGAASNTDGTIDTTSTTKCYFGPLAMKTGDSYVFSRSQNKIQTTSYLIIYDENGTYVSSRSVTTGTTITFDRDGKFCICCYLNSNVSATMEEAIAAANTSFTATLATQFEIVSKINSLDADVEELKEFESSVAPVVELSEKIIVSDGVAYDQDSLLTGKYYSVSNGVVSINTESSAKYCNLVDVSALRGHRLIVRTNSIKSGSARAFGFCDAENNVGNYKTETSMILMPDGTRMTVLLVDKDYMFFSCSSTPTTVSVEIATEYLFATDAEVNRRMETRKYYHFSFDDVYLCLQDITTNASTYQSIFENSFLAWCKEMHDKYGTTFSMYVFYQNAASNPTWSLEDCTNAFAAEFTANADWLKFGFHAHDPESTATSRASSAASDYSSAMTQLVRITGSVACIDRVPRLHNYNGSLEAITAMRDCDLGPVGLIASADYSSSQPRDSYYFDAAQNAYIAKHIYMYDAETFLHFVKTSLIWADPNGDPDENDPANVNADKYVELFTHENQLTSGMKTTYEKKIAKLAYYHLPYYMMNMVLTN